ncbi:MAG: MSEP-CTERM sorting domain-containing protein [Bacteroidota bacterium]|nr:MSEP-CTERM sorting domain-containing protein [Bacteroidota bacterium]
MRNLHNPKWLYIVNTLPLVVLFFLFFGQFSIIKTLLDEDCIRLWKIFGLSLGVLGLLNFLYAVYLTLKKKSVSVWYGVIALVCYISFLYLYACYLHDVFPSSIPRWMVSGNLFLYVGTFLMPTLAYALFILVSHFTPENKEHKAGVNFLIAVGIPLLAYLFVQIILPLWQYVEGRFYTHAFLVLAISATVVFLFFLVRGVFIIATKKAHAWQKYQLAWKIPIAIVLPLLGLLVNNGLLFDDFGTSDSGIFGDFSNAWFYILAVINGTLVSLPNLENKTYRLLLFIGRSITFAYTLYFFLVFLPFLPLSVIAIIAIGTGFLMLTPLLLFVIHINELSKDFAYLKPLFSKIALIGMSVAGFLLIPAGITATYLKDKSVLHETLSYLYTPDYSKRYDINKVSLQKTLKVIKSHKRGSRGGVLGNGIPYLSSYFNWLVMDNLTLSDAKISTIEKVFFGNSSFKLRPEEIQNDNVQITNISTHSTYDNTQHAWKSWVDLEITNKSGNSRVAEYATTIDLPIGCWISNYYLYVGDKKEPGVLAEKKSAMWIFSQIRNENRDPGILYYLTGNKVAFRVFPFAKDEVRKTGIEFLHKEPIQLNVDGNVVELGNDEETMYENIETENVAYVSARQKQQLNWVKREPYFHFLVDVAKEQKGHSTDFIQRVERVVDAYPPLSENAKISFVNSYVNTIEPLEGDWKEQLKNQTFDGGFYLDRAIKTVLYHAYLDNSNRYPVIVVVTDSMHLAVLDKDFADFRFAFPESDLFFHLDKNGNLREHSLMDNPIKELPEIERECMFCETVLEYRLSDNSIAYLPNNNEPSIILKRDIFEVTETEIKEKNWQSALNMQGQWMSQTIRPETSNEGWQNLVKQSFISKVMTPVTSYLVVENEAQKAMLKKKQEEALSGDKSLDLGEETQRMSEPSLILLTILLFVLVGYREKRKRRRIA